MTQELPQDVLESLAQFLGRAPERITRLQGGANNLVLEVVLGGSRYLAKAYFKHPNDPRDRLGAEFGMLTFLWKHGVRCVPEPLQADPVRQVGLYEFVDGRRLAPGEVTEEDVRQLVDILLVLWRLRGEEAAAGMPGASDACFSIRGFIENIGGRFGRVNKALGQGGVIKEAGDYIRGDLARVWDRLVAFMEEGARRAGLDAGKLLEREQQTLNPADHGFHNTLREADGRLRFLDFEYAGWDDPAQMLANALWQPAVPLPREHVQPFLRAMLRAMPEDAALPDRLRLVYPILGFKWSLIMLNEFLPVSEERRRFAGGRPESHRQEQLEKSKCCLKEVERYLDMPVLL